MNEKTKEPLFHIVKRDALPWYQSIGIRAEAIVVLVPANCTVSVRSAC